MFIGRGEQRCEKVCDVFGVEVGMKGWKCGWGREGEGNDGNSRCGWC